MGDLLKLYQFLNSAYGQLRGYDRWRIRRAAERNALLSPAELNRLSTPLLHSRAREAIRLFPAYAEKVKSFGGAFPKAGIEIDPGELPIWTREDQKNLFLELNDPPGSNCFVHSTGGSTGVPLKFYVTRRSYEWRAAVSDRGYSWAGAEEGKRSFYVWGTPIKPPGMAKKVKAGIHHWAQRRTYFDSFQFGDGQKELCCRAINRIKPPVVVGYAGNLIELAAFVRDNPASLNWRTETLITAAEGLLPGKREFLHEYLGGKVQMSYGSREFMLIGMECREQKGYHISADNLFVEVVDAEGRPAEPGETGRILITDLRNTANPFIRYEIGDYGAMAEPGYVCPCGLPFPMLAKVEGRIQEVIELPDGNRLTALFVPHLMKEFEWVDGYQVQQDNPREIVMNLVTRSELTEELTATIEDALREKVGPEMQIGFKKVEQLQKNRSGKTPIVVGGAGE